MVYTASITVTGFSHTKEPSQHLLQACFPLCPLYPIDHSLALVFHTHAYLPLQVPYTAEALAGLGTACVQVCVTQPYELVKLRQQTVAGQSLGDTMKELGLKGLTRGTSATLLRDVSALPCQRRHSIRVSQSQTRQTAFAACMSCELASMHISVQICHFSYSDSQGA